MKRRFPPKLVKWTNEFAYAVGLITTDGSLSKDKRHITLTSTDIQLLNVFKSCIKKNNKLTLNPGGKLAKKIAYKIQIGDVNLYDFLLEIGLFPNKSLKLGAIKIPHKFFRNFLRGHLDGDGSIIYYKDKYNTKLNPNYIYDRLFIYFLSGSKKHIQWLQKIIYQLKGIRGSLNTLVSQRKNKKSIYYRLKFSTKQAKIILNWIYYKPDLPCLIRKYNIAKPFIN